MSTFGGVMVELPDVRVDFFRPLPGFRPPLACFLSHVHSDHLAGLESFKSPFIYCSAATKELLLRLERYPHRLNFERGILEARKQTYKHLQKLLKPIPLETPTRIELQPGKHIQVTLFDANHCTGAVMFLFEGDGKAVLYTGDIRSEPWFVNSLTRNPLLIEYTSRLKTLDCIYLDTSNTQPIEFPTKADGITELLDKVLKYPPDTVFHFTAWTFGYEEVWMALSRALNSKIHVDRYKLRLYQSLRGDSNGNEHSSAAFLRHDGPILAGYTCGNMPQEGCLTDSPKVRLHSCEKGMHCSTINESTVWIKPIIARTKGGEMAEIGVGGGGGDLAQRPELELGNELVIDKLLSLFQDQEGSVLNDVKEMFLAALRTKGRAVSLENMGLDRQEDELSLPELAKAISRSLTQKRSSQAVESKQQEKELPRVITFPYSRHSSYAELCDLVKVFRPKDVYACTVDSTTWHEGISIEYLFGDLCSASIFRHDIEMRKIISDKDDIDRASQQTRTTERSTPSPMMQAKVLTASYSRGIGRGDSLNQSAGKIGRLTEKAMPMQSREFGPKPSHRGGSDDDEEGRDDNKPAITAMTVRRNSEGRLRPFDAFGNEVSLATYLAQNAAPPQQLVAVSPGSASQNLRRKAIVDSLGERDLKRARLHLDGLGSAPLGIFDTPGDPSTQDSHAHSSHRFPALRLYSHSQGSGADSNMDDREARDSSEYPSNTITLDYEQVATSGFNEDSILNDEDTFFDFDDRVIRCRYCNHEVFTPVGLCTNASCRDGLLCDPYFEVIDPEFGPRPGIALNEYSAEIGDDVQRREIVGNYLDDHSSAYDTQDEDDDHHFNEDYDEDDSMIDNESHVDPEEEDNDSSGSDGETDWKEKYNQLQATHNQLLVDYMNLDEENDDLKRDFLGSDYNSELDGEERDEDGMLVVNVAVPDPVVTEVVLSHAQEGSQSSEITPDRLRDRAVAFEAASTGDGWHNISMVSTQDNHTHAEIEL